MRLKNFNVEWMNDWFVGGGKVAFRKDNPVKGIYDTDALARRVAGLIQEVDPDVATIEEGPSDIEEMRLFVSTYLSDAYEVFGGIDGGAQKIYALCKKGAALSGCHVADDNLTLGLKKTWESDVDGDEVAEAYKFTRQPLVVLGYMPDGKPCRIVAMHTKSNYIQGGDKVWNNPATRPQFIREALKDRRHISSEAMRVREYFDALLSADPSERIVVAGDLNDGPGFDYFELRYLTHNVIDILLGSTFDFEMLFRHAFIDRVDSNLRFTCEFYDYVEAKDMQLLLDHIAVSPALGGKIVGGGILHKKYADALDPNARGDRQKRPSDHRPVFVDIG